MRKRRTNEQICEDLRIERNRLYSKRTRTNKLLSKSLSQKERKKNERALARFNKRIVAINDKMYKCGNNYAKLKRQKRKLKTHQAYLMRKSKQEGITKSERGRIYEDGRKTQQELRDIERTMRLPYQEIYRGKLGTDYLGDKKFAEIGGLWQCSAQIKRFIDSPYFKIFIINGQEYSTDNIIRLLTALDDAISKGMIYGAETGSPKYSYIADEKQGIVDITI